MKEVIKTCYEYKMPDVLLCIGLKRFMIQQKRTRIQEIMEIRYRKDFAIGQSLDKGLPLDLLFDMVLEKLIRGTQGREHNEFSL